MQLIREIRKKRPSIWINLSTGTWPSPFWLMHADCIWRRGHDHFFVKRDGKPEGAPREDWITYRDGQTYG